MLRETFSRLLLFIILFLLQALVFNDIHILGCICAMVYVFFAVSFRRGYPKWATMLWCFAMGLAMDTLTNTPGMAAASLTLVGAIQPYYLELFLNHEAAPDFKPTAKNLGLIRYAGFCLLLVFIHSLVMALLELFTVVDFVRLGISVCGTTLLTLLLCLTADRLTPSGKRQRN